MLGPISRIRGNSVEFEDGKECSYDSIVFATGYKMHGKMVVKVGMYISSRPGVIKRNYFILFLNALKVAIIKSI